MQRVAFDFIQLFFPIAFGLRDSPRLALAMYMYVGAVYPHLSRNVITFIGLVQALTFFAINNHPEYHDAILAAFVYQTLHTMQKHLEM